MGCFYPLAATRLSAGGKILIHKRTPGIQVKPTPPELGQDLKLPCNNCIGCRVDRSKQWAIRLLCEAQLHERSSFLTLTYNEETLSSRRLGWEPTVPYTPPSDAPISGNSSHRKPPSLRSSYPDSLRPRDLQLFMKRLRRSLTTRGGSARVRFYGVGEYGETYQRPHYHIALFGEDFSGDRYHWRTSGENAIWRSPRLEKLWPHGNSEIGQLTIQSAMYVASYVMKKVNGKKADEHYKRECPVTGDYLWLWPEFALMSRGGRKGRGLAHEWLTKYSADVYNQDHVVHQGRQMRPPRYFDKLLEEFDPVRMAEIRFEREMRAKELAEDNTPARLAVKEHCLKDKLGRKKHQLEQP